MTQNILIGILIPFIGTTLGSMMVFFLKKEMPSFVTKFLLGFSSGVMIAASVWSLLIPSIDLAKDAGNIPWLPASVGFMLGIGFLLALDTIIPHIHLNSQESEGLKTKFSRSVKLMFAVTLHNIPEGLAVGVIFAGIVTGNNAISLSSAFALSIGIAIQNFPEGAIISMPLQNEGFTKKKAFLYGSLSGIVEPIAALFAIYMSNVIVPLLPYFLSFAAGAMIYVVVEELIPESQNGIHSNVGTIGVAFGFVLMMILDVALG